MNIELQTNHPIAVTSPDHVKPWGTRRDNWSSPLLVQTLYNYFKRPYALLDLGCAGCQFVVDVNNTKPCIGVGLEGSDYNINRQHFNWKQYYNKRLFTCDITYPFQLLLDDKPMKFDCITSWEFLEHVHPGRIEIVLDNVKRHMYQYSIFIGQYALTGDSPEGLQLHQCIKPVEWWNEQFGKYFSINKPYPFSHTVRPDCVQQQYFLQI